LEDELKIEKASLLFSQNNVEKTTHLKHILKLAFKFLFSKKFLECEKTLDKFSHKLKNNFIIDNLDMIGKDYKNDMNFNKFNYNNTNNWLLSILFEEYSEEIKNKYNTRFYIPLCFCKQLIEIINDCFFSYLKLSKLVITNNITDQHKQNIVNVNFKRNLYCIKIFKN